jgi:antitoxin component of RelBE/YafQ-DinJ toxin-antitoxin module
MKFRDIFLPKIAHSNPDVRIKAIETEENAELLEQVTQNDSDPRVVKAAKKRLEALSEPVG